MKVEDGSGGGYASNDIAIIGMSCRFPGDASSPRAFWDFLLSGGDGIVEVPPDRWNNAAYYDTDKEKPNKIYVNRAGFISSIDQFDPQFFGISPNVNILLRPELPMLICKASMPSPEGRCKSFDVSANGYVRSEGAGVVIVKKLVDARRDGDPVLAVIKATGVNQDGQTIGITVPNRESQKKLLKQSLNRAASHRRRSSTPRRTEPERRWVTRLKSMHRANFWAREIPAIRLRDRFGQEQHLPFLNWLASRETATVQPGSSDKDLKGSNRETEAVVGKGKESV